MKDGAEIKFPWPKVELVVDGALLADMTRSNGWKRSIRIGRFIISVQRRKWKLAKGEFVFDRRLWEAHQKIARETEQQLRDLPPS